jgi:hypothetical protein
VIDTEKKIKENVQSNPEKTIELEEEVTTNTKETAENTAPKNEKKNVDPKMEMISAYNGDVTDKYVWSQSVTDVTVQVKVPEGTKSKMVF